MSDTSFTAETNGGATEEPAAAAQAAPNPMLSALLGAMGSGGSFDPASLLMSQLGNQGANDSRMAALSWLLSQQRPGPQIEGEVEDAEIEQAKAEAARARAEARAERARRIRELRALVKRAWTELDALRERNDTLAAALGACHLCFGADPMCPHCGGRGGAGSRAPDPVAYRQYVVPAIRRVRVIAEALARQGPDASENEGAVRRALAARMSGHEPVPERRTTGAATSEQGRVTA